jgi:hypothetical protein
MTRQTGYLLRMLGFLVLVAIVGVLLSPRLHSAFWYNPVLNCLIFFVELCGIAWNLRQVLVLQPEVTWVETFQRGRARLATLPTPKLLASMASMLAARAGKNSEGNDRVTLSASSMRSLLDGIASRLDESRELSRYMTGLMIFLGLLGTFWGLLRTVGAVSDVISGLSVASGDISAMFGQLKAGLVQPLHGMGTAFSSSMFGLAGALVLGFLDLTAGQAQNRFYNELEDWLASLTRLSSGVLGGEGETPVPVYVQALLEHTAENMEELQRILVRGEDGRSQVNHALALLTDKLATLSDTMRTNQQLMLRIAEAHAALAPALTRFADQRAEGGLDEAARAHLRSMDLTLQRLLAESEQGRQQSTTDLRNDLRLLTRTVAALAEEQPR